MFTGTATSAEPRPELPTQTLDGLRQQALKGETACAVVVPPSGDVVTFDITPRRPDGSVEHGPGQGNLVQANLDRLELSFEAMTATKPGLDTIGTITAAVRRHPAPARMVVVTSGISTVSPVDIGDLGWDFDAGDLAARLRAGDELPDLTGWKVDILGVGDVGGNSQPQTTMPLQTRLRTLWNTVCTTAGAASCSVPADLVGFEPPRATNAVPVIPLPAPTVDPNHVSFPGAFFDLDSAELGHDVDAELLRVVIQARTSGAMVHVVGRTDAVTGTQSHNLQLSQQRADALRDRLIDLGLPAAQITAIGVGPRDASPGRERLDPSQIAKDRRVDITVGVPAIPDHS